MASTSAQAVPYGRSVIAPSRLSFLTELCRLTLMACPGNVLEVGVFRGGSLLSLATAAKEIAPTVKVFGIDTFFGHPYSDGHPEHPIGKYGCVNQEEVQRIFESHGLIVTLIRGCVEEVGHALQIEPLSFVHVDCDLYVPVKFCIENFYPLLQPGGVIAFDDFGHPFCPGATRAVDEAWSIDSPARHPFPRYGKECGLYVIKE